MFDRGWPLFRQRQNGDHRLNPQVKFPIGRARDQKKGPPSKTMEGPTMRPPDPQNHYLLELDSITKRNGPSATCVIEIIVQVVRRRLRIIANILLIQDILDAQS